MNTLNPIIGNESVIDILRQLIDSDRLATAVGFLGPNGVGKSTAAVWFAQRNLCERDNGPCGNCSQCRRTKNGTSDRLYVIEGNDTESISIDQIRAAVEKFAYVLEGQAWFIVSRADRMTEQAQNALLKFLEEPPRQLRIILTAPHASVLAPTVRSRLSLYHWQRVPATLLREAFPKAAIDDIRAADGRPGVLIGLLDDTERRQWVSQASHVLTACFTQQPLPVLISEEPEQLYRAEEGLLRDALLRDVGLDVGLVRPDFHGTSPSKIVQLLERLLNRFSSRQHISSQTQYAHLHLV